MSEIIINKSTAILILILTGLSFIFLSYRQLRSKISNKDYLVSGRNESCFPLTLSLSASALGAWVLFSPASAATWGGIGTVLGYALGAAFPMIIIYFIGPKLRKEMPNAFTFTQLVRKRFGDKFFKFSLVLIIFYLIVFLCAEVTAISLLLNYLSNVQYWVTALITLVICLSYILKGGLKLSIITDKFQFILLISIFIFIYLYLYSSNSEIYSLKFLKENSLELFSRNYFPNYTGAITFFIAVATTNLFHQGNWQRVFAAKNNCILKKSLIYSSLIIFPIVFLMGYSGLVAFSINKTVNPDLSFFSLLLGLDNSFIYFLIIVFALSLTFSTIDTLINAISSLIIVDGKIFFKEKKVEILKISKIIIIMISIVVFFVSSQGISILYLFLLADLICCCATIPIFEGLIRKKINLRLSLFSLILSLCVGLLIFPSADFSRSLLTHVFFSPENFNEFILSNLLFLSFIIGFLTPVVINFIYSFRTSFK